MPDLSCALRDAAGTPLVPLDLPDVHDRGRRRRRNVAAGRAAAAAAVLSVVAVAGTLTLDRDDRQVLQPAIITTTPSATPSPAPQLADGTVDVQVLGASADRTVVVDEVTEKPACDLQLSSEGGGYEKQFRSCFDDDAELPLSLRVSPDLVTVEVHPEGDPVTEMPWSQFASYVSGRTGSPDFVYTVWEATVTDGEVTELRQVL